MSKKIYQVNNSLYPASYIQDTLVAFVGYEITYSHNTLTIDDEDPQYVFDEFMNYTLSLLLENPLWA